VPMVVDFASSRRGPAREGKPARTEADVGGDAQFLEPSIDPGERLDRIRTHWARNPVGSGKDSRPQAWAPQTGGNQLLEIVCADDQVWPVSFCNRSG